MSLSDDSLKDKYVKLNEEESSKYVDREQLILFGNEIKDLITKKIIEDNIDDREALLIRITTINCEVDFLKQLLHNRVRELMEEIKLVESKLDKLEEVTYRNINVNSKNEINVNNKTKLSITSKVINTILESPVILTIVTILATTSLTFFLHVLSAYVKHITGVHVPVPEIELPNK